MASNPASPRPPSDAAAIHCRNGLSREIGCRPVVHLPERLMVIVASVRQIRPFPSSPSNIIGILREQNAGVRPLVVKGTDIQQRHVEAWSPASFLAAWTCRKPSRSASPRNDKRPAKRLAAGDACISRKVAWRKPRMLAASTSTVFPLVHCGLGRETTIASFRRSAFARVSQSSPDIEKGSIASGTALHVYAVNL